MEPLRQPPRILIIEDEPLIAMGLKLVLENMGCVVPSVVDNETDAVKMAEHQDFDLILADVRLKGGGDALPGAQRLIQADGSVQTLPGCFSVEVQAGEAIEIETPGGGGFGPA